MFYKLTGQFCVWRKIFSIDLEIKYLGNSQSLQSFFRILIPHSCLLSEKLIYVKNYFSLHVCLSFSVCPYMCLSVILQYIGFIINSSRSTVSVTLNMAQLSWPIRFKTTLFAQAFVCTITLTKYPRTWYILFTRRVVIRNEFVICKCRITK